MKRFEREETGNEEIGSTRNIRSEMVRNWKSEEAEAFRLRDENMTEIVISIDTNFVTTIWGKSETSKR